MRLEAPKFWQHKGFIAQILRPFALLYGLIHRKNFARQIPYNAKIPVLCIGGVVAGGSGKTPVLHAILNLIREHGVFENPVILCRGYGGALKGPSVVAMQVHTALDVGDEALLHARFAPTIIAADRGDGAKLAEMMEADVILMDDGLQNNTLEKSLSFLVMDARYKVGNGYLLPSGPLREPFEDALKRCAAIISTNGELNNDYDLPLLKTQIDITSTHDKTKKYFGFCGIAHPAKFQKTLENHGFFLSGFKDFPDHYVFTDKDMENLLFKANDAKLITTEKDFVRVPEKFKSRVEVLSMELFFENPDHLLSILRTL